MRGQALRDVIIARIEALVPDYQSSARDRFTYDPDQTDEEPRPERSFLLVQGQLMPSSSFTTMHVTVAFQLKVFYQDDPKAGERILADGERIMTSLWGVSGALHQDITGVTKMGDWVPSPGMIDGQLVGTIDFAVSYQLTF